MLRTALLEYDLPADRVATHPVDPRDSARLMVVDRRDPARVEDRAVRDLPDLLSPGDLVIVNATRVLPARFRGQRVGTQGQFEGLYLHDVVGAPAGPLRWACFIKGRHTRESAAFELHDAGDRPTGVVLHVEGRVEHEPGAWIARVETPSGIPLSTVSILDHLGTTPLPPYIRRARKDRGEDPDAGEAVDREVYQTVYAHRESKLESHGERGSVAAPTAGLHFTPSLLQRLDERGLDRAEVTLHVGAGTFKPIETEFVEQHPMHREWCSIAPETIEKITRARARGGRVVAIGTTSVRTLESYAAIDAPQTPTAREWPAAIETRMLITPGYSWRWTDALLTNFHLPRSTLLALVGAMLPGPPEIALETLKGLYARAIERGYRFYSFGDAMLLL